MIPISSVLLVDGDANTNFLNKALLQRLSVPQHLTVAENGAEALQMLHQTCIPLSSSCLTFILLDMKNASNERYRVFGNLRPAFVGIAAGYCHRHAHHLLTAAGSGTGAPVARCERAQQAAH